MIELFKSYSEDEFNIEEELDPNEVVILQYVHLKKHRWILIQIQLERPTKFFQEFRMKDKKHVKTIQKIKARQLKLKQSDT